MKKILLISFLVVILAGAYWVYANKPQVQEAVNEKLVESIIPEELHPAMIDSLRQRTYDSIITIERDLGDKGSFHSYLISYPSDGLKLYALMNVPDQAKPPGGFPVLFLNHGFIEPKSYSTQTSYQSFTDFYSRNGFLVLKPDYRGHDDSEGSPDGGDLNAGYTIDVLNLLSAIKKYPDANPQKIGMWGHSMGGGVTLRAVVVSKDIRATMLVAGVVASPERMIAYASEHQNDPRIPGYIKTRANEIINSFLGRGIVGKISPYNYLDSIAGPVSIHHGTADASVPLEFSQELRDALVSAGKTPEYFEYPGADHNLATAGSRSLFLQRSLQFFSNNLK